MPIFDLFPLQPRRGAISVERSESPISEPRTGDIYNFDKIFTHPTTKNPFSRRTPLFDAGKPVATYYEKNLREASVNCLFFILQIFL